MEDQIRKQLAYLLLFPHESFLRANTSANNSGHCRVSETNFLSYAFGDILWIPKGASSTRGVIAVNVTRIRSVSACHWDADFLAEIFRVCHDSLAVHPTELHQASERVSTNLKLKTHSRDLLGLLPPLNQCTSPVGLFCPQSCNIRRSIVIVGPKGLRKEAVLKCLWSHARDAFYIPSTVFEVEEAEDEPVTGANWPLALSDLDEAYRNWKKHRKHHVLIARVGSQLSAEMLTVARRTVKMGRIPIVVVAPSVLQEWRASAELAAFVVLLQLANAKAKSYCPVSLENVDIRVIHTPRNPTKTARTIVEAFYNMNSGKGPYSIPWKPDIWYNTYPMITNI